MSPISEQKQVIEGGKMAAGHYSDLYLKQSLACKQESWNQTAADHRAGERGYCHMTAKGGEKVSGIRLDLNANQTQSCHFID